MKLLELLSGKPVAARQAQSHPPTASRAVTGLERLRETMSDASNSVPELRSALEGYASHPWFAYERHVFCREPMRARLLHLLRVLREGFPRRHRITAARFFEKVFKAAESNLPRKFAFHACLQQCRLVR
jgi:hypothetical protein